MFNNLEKYKKELNDLIELGDKMYLDLLTRNQKKYKKIEKKVTGSFENLYQKWYTVAYSVIEQIIPARLIEFKNLYLGDSKKNTNSATSFTIQDWLNGIRAGINSLDQKRFNDFEVITRRFNTQRKILESAKNRFESSLFDIKKIVQADLFDSEIGAAKELLKKGFLRGAGAISGVILEKHLNEVCNNHNLQIGKKNPAIADYNDLLKTNDVIEIQSWRFIQCLADIRNLCDHNKDREPTKDEVNELIIGVEKISKTIF